MLQHEGGNRKGDILEPYASEVSQNVVPASAAAVRASWAAFSSVVPYIVAPIPGRNISYPLQEPRMNSNLPMAPYPIAETSGP